MVRKYRRRSHRHQRQHAVGTFHRVRTGTYPLQLQRQVLVQRLLPPGRLFRLFLHRQPMAELLLRRPGLADERGGMDEGHHLAGHAETERLMGHTGQPKPGPCLSRRTVADECLLRRVRHPVRHLSGLPACLPAQPQTALGEGGSLGSRCRSQLPPQPPAL